MSSSPSRRLVVVVVGVALVLLAAVLIANAADEDPGPESSTQAGSSVSDKTEPGLDRPARGEWGPSVTLALRAGSASSWPTAVTAIRLPTTRSSTSAIRVDPIATTSTAPP